MTTLALAALLGACTKPIVVDGVEVHPEHWQRTQEELRPRVAFDLNCPAEQAEFHLFKRMGKYPTEVGVEACGKRATYLRSLYGPWVLNVGSSSAPPTTSGASSDANAPAPAPAPAEASTKPTSLPPWTEQTEQQTAQ